MNVLILSIAVLKICNQLLNMKMAKSVQAKTDYPLPQNSVLLLLPTGTIAWNTMCITKQNKFLSKYFGLYCLHLLHI